MSVPDEKLAVLSDLNKSEKTVPATLEFVDVAGLIKGASTGEGLGNEFLATIRQVRSKQLKLVESTWISVVLFWPTSFVCSATRWCMWYVEMVVSVGVGDLRKSNSLLWFR